METKLCRICGKLGQNFIHIFKTEGLRSKIETCLPIIVSPYCLLPDAICEECTATVDNFYTFIKNCLQNIIILEAQYDIRESCLKSKQKRDKGSHVDFGFQKSNKGVQTDDFLDVLSGRHADLKELGSSLPQTLAFLKEEAPFTKNSSSLVDYEVESDSSLDENLCNGKVELSEERQSLDKITKFVDSITSREVWPKKLRCYSLGSDLISEITQRRNLKRKSDVIEVHKPRIYSGLNKRKNKVPKRIDTQDVGGAIASFQTPDEIDEPPPQGTENYDTIIQTATPSQDERLPATVLLQTCLLCEAQLAGPAALNSHVFEVHGIDMVSEAASLGSGDSLPEKSKKKIPNLVKISDLKRNDPNDETLERMNEDPPTLQPSFVCPNCPGDFTSKPDLMAHLRARHPELAAYLCGICMHQCTSAAHLTHHLQGCAQQHPPAARYVCRVCHHGEDSLKALEGHVLEHDFLLDACRRQLRVFDPEDYIQENGEAPENGGLKGPGCAECGLGEFRSFAEFSAHRRDRHSIFHCDLCAKFYGRNSHLWKHVNRLHKGHPSITCQLCHKTSASKYHLLQHFNKAHSSRGAQSEDFMSQKFSAFDFQSVKQSFMRQELSEAVKDADSDEPQWEEEEEEELVAMEEPASAPKEIDSSHNLYTNIITNYTPPPNEGDYKCPKCSKAFQKKLLLKKHKKNCRPRNQKDLLTRCKTCSRTFKDRQSLAKHLVNYHSEYVCEICGGKMQSKCEIVAHIRSRHPGCHLFCGMCRNVLRSRGDLQEHLRDHPDSYVCQFCGDALPSKIKLKMHILSLHRKMLSLSCGICLKLFETQHVLRDHVRLVHEGQLAPLTSCPVCGKNYGSKWKTFDHLNKSHGRIFRACKTCLAVFESEAQLQAHCDATAHGAAAPPKSVPPVSAPPDVVSDSAGEEDQSDSGSCSPQEAKIALLEKRILGGGGGSKRTVYVNSNDPSRCEICLKTWPAKKHLWQHYIRCHKAVAATVCGICLKTNDGYASLQRHLRDTHPSLLHGQGFGSNFICRVCGRYHNASSKLRLHMVIHENLDWAALDQPAAAADAAAAPASDDINFDSLIEQVECSEEAGSSSSEDDSDDGSAGSSSLSEGESSEGEAGDDGFGGRPEELDSAVQSISFEQVKEEDVDEGEEYCELQNPSYLNDNEIESAVGSIL